MALGLGIGLHKKTGQGTSWTPAELIGSGLEGWWQSGVGYTTSGVDVIQWDDQSGNDRHWVDGGVASRRPTLVGGNYLSFDGVNNLMTLGAELSMDPSPFTIAYVTKSVDAASGKSLLSRNASADAWVKPKGATLVDPFNSPSGLLDHLPWFNSSFQHGVITNDGSTLTVYGNGSQTDIEVVTSSFILFQVLFCRRVSDKIGITAGHLKEMVLVSSALSGPDLTNLFNYLDTLL